MRLFAGGNEDKSSKKNSKEKEKNQLPRRCAVIRRTFPEDGVEKTELRFVVYKKPSGKLDKQGFLDEIGQFLKEQSGDMNKDDTRSEVTSMASSKATTPTTTAMSTTAETKPTTESKATTTMSDMSIVAMSAQHHKKECNNAEAVRKALPLLEELVHYFRDLEKNSKRKDVGAMRQTSEQVLADAQQTLINGGKVGRGLLSRVKALNELAEKTRPSVISPVPSSVNLSASHVNAVSDTDISPRRL